MKDNRRNFIKKGTSLAALSVIGLGSGISVPIDYNDSKSAHGSESSARKESKKNVQWPVTEGPETPKICMNCGYNADEKGMRRVKQLGVNYVIMSGPRIPWTEADLRSTMERFKAGGLTVINMMISGFNNTILGREGRYAEIENIKKSVVAAGAAGLPVIEYNFYVNRLTAGYYPVEGRGGSGYLGFNYDPVRNLPHEPNTGAHSAEELWSNLTYFLKAVIPVAEKACVRLALHPNDPPATVSHGSDQIMGSVKERPELLTRIFKTY